MKEIITRMLERLCSPVGSEIISWASPVPSFGDLHRASVATLGINPSKREFVDERGMELTAHSRRFHTLRSLDLRGWTDAGKSEIEKIITSCQDYFFRNPYDGWFRRLDRIVAGTGFSYYDKFFPACHIDLLPFATDQKWGALPATRRKSLLRRNADLWSDLLGSSNLRLLILNGQSVVSEFEAAVGTKLECREMPGWTLPRNTSKGVAGIAYSGTCAEVEGIKLRRPIRILGYNHNIQSSFGVTSAVTREIAKWVSDNSRL